MLQPTNSTFALAAKAEVGRKSLVARRAGSIPASGTTKKSRAVQESPKTRTAQGSAGFLLSGSVQQCAVTSSFFVYLFVYLFSVPEKGTHLPVISTFSHSYSGYKNVCMPCHAGRHLAGVAVCCSAFAPLKMRSDGSDIVTALFLKDF
ncbi:hypothetical protein ACFSQE_06260 [Vogesella fluminis]|uniref:hypothetical protein n=1 Tax=Vogesella fluminis TaxID=1069161 RepID=UPI00363961A9